jgi:hypothetical protein
MNITINIVETSSEIAYNKLMQHYEELGENRYFDFPNGIEIEEDDEVHYTDEGQKKFDEFYDEIYFILNELKIE